ncbi:hypothetical protein UFOVP826_8 [uncultured Caudovirales phage]|uniref:Uncharacterized protein n=1 Tax=uncultured Caudovirales phage TaxID=2100421 RepID=A0A6J5P4D5_9CAUD|nr:hypothetical protein UFOVP826_8 [uncultured Caudovirales phage]
MTCQLCDHFSNGYCGKYPNPNNTNFATGAGFALTERCFGRGFAPTDLAKMINRCIERGEQLGGMK